MKHYAVISPEMSETIPILDYGQGPLEYFHCVAMIEADSPKDAKALALRTDDFRPWVKECRSDGVNPFSGLTVETPTCPHGVCACGCEAPDCVECLAEMEAEELLERQERVA